MTIDEIIKEARPKMEATISRLVEELKKIRAGRANPEIVDGIMVSYYGTTTPLREMASISVPESTQIAIKPWDRNALSDIETAIRNSDLGLSPINDGVSVRLVLPPLTEERRKQIASQVKKMGEEARVALRNVRGEAWAKVQEGEKRKEVTEDDRYMAEEELNKLIGEMNKKVDQSAADKEAEILKI
ncbi:MAG: ribosome recycling factor [Patescibacteria group bacterium]